MRRPSLPFRPFRKPVVLAVESALLALLLAAGAVDGHNTAGVVRKSTSTEAVSGEYVGSATLYLDAQAGPLPEVGEVGANVFGGVTACNLESLGSSLGVPELDETKVDSTATTGLVPDGTWDDGGVGGACHPLGGCPVQEWFGPTPMAYAEDVVFGGAVWIAVACDYLHPVEGLAMLDSAAVCAANWALSDRSVPGAVDCVTPLVSCYTNPPCITSSSYACGGDGIPDSYNLGTGDPGVPYPALDQCPRDGTSPVVFTLDAVFVDARPATPVVDAVLPTKGWIDGDGFSGDDAGLAWIFYASPVPWPAVN